MSSGWFVLPLLVGIGFGAAAGDDSWWQARTPCPDNARLRGRAPPLGRELGCRRPSGAWHGRRTVWFEACRAPSCTGNVPPKRYEGEYRRGVEHGWWTWWKPDGRKGLEGEYWAGKKAGVWRAWDAAGKERVTHFPTHDTATESADAAILDALRAASAAGNKDLAKELDAAAKELMRHGGTAGALETRGAPTASQSLGTAAVMGQGKLDLPNEDLGRTEFEDGEGSEANPYVQGAIAKASASVHDCYRETQARTPGAAGEVFVRFVIDTQGRPGDVRVVRSDLPESFNQCVRAAVGRLTLPPHEGASPVEVISSWTLKATR
jgi:TonB family protein